MGYAGEDGLFSLEEMQQAIMANDSKAARLLVAGLIEACESADSAVIEGEEIDLTAPCQVMKEYGKSFNLDDKGAALFREWLSRYSIAQTKQADKLFKNAFDANEPVNRPNTIADTSLALRNLAQAANVLTASGFALDASMGDTQFAFRGDAKIAIHGGNEYEGVANVIGQRVYDTLVFQERGQSVEGSKYLKDKGYPVTYGTSFIMTLSYTDNGPVAEAFLTYGQSGDPDSAYFTDQTNLFSTKDWRPVLFTEEQIAQGMLSSKTVEAKR